jgi:hypothetical protein
MGQNFRQTLTTMRWEWATSVSGGAAIAAPPHHSGVPPSCAPDALPPAMPPAMPEAKIMKHAGCHTLRHSFATPLLADGDAIRTVQELHRRGFAEVGVRSPLMP